MSENWWERERQILRKCGYTEKEIEDLINKHKHEIDPEVEGFLEANRDQIEELSDPEFDLLFWATLIFGTLSAISFLLRLFSGSRSKKVRAREEGKREELIV